MSRKAVAFRDCLNEQEACELKALTLACNEADGTRYAAPVDGDLFFLLYNKPEDTAFEEPAQGKLVAALVVFHMGDQHEGQPVDELAACTLPVFRRRGAFQKLLREAAPLLREAVRFAVYDAPVTAAVLRALHARHTSDECMMCRRLSGENRSGDTAQEKRPEPLPADLALIQREGERAYWKYGECMLRSFGSTVYCYGVLTYARFRGQGFGRRFLAALFAKLSEEGAETVLLEVSSENRPALRLYEGLGFQVTERIQYHYLPRDWSSSERLPL